MRSIALGAGSVLVALVVAACSLANAPGDAARRADSAGSGGSGPPTCTAPASLCDRACIDLNTNKLNCGKCGKACPGLELCVAGACALNCPGGTKACSEKCVDVKVDPTNCGECGMACLTAAGAQPICIGGKCDIACKDPMRDCDKQKMNGCEIDTSMSTTDCGACGNRCPAAAPNASPKCTSGICAKNCTMGFDDCDMDLSNGCEAELKKNMKHCGKCGTACNMANNEFCKQGTCEQQQHNWTILEQKDIVYKSAAYLLLKLKYNSTTSFSQNWCQDYTNLCTSFGYKPTGCDGPTYGGTYLICTNTYQSFASGDPLGCNPSSGVASAAQQNGYNDANSQNSFGFHVCDAGSCTKTMCSGSNCNNSLTYFDFAKPHGYTLCRK